MELDPTHHVDVINGRFEGTSADDLTELFAALPDQPLVVHFHGGLVGKAAALKTAHRLEQVYVSAPAYPVFFIWHAGLLEVIGHNLSQIASEKVFRRVRDLLLQHAIGKARDDDGAKGLTLDLPQLDEVHAMVATDPAAFELEAPALREGDGELGEAQEGWVLDQLQADPVLTEEELRLGSDEGAKGLGLEGEPGETMLDKEILDEVRTGAGDKGIVSGAVLAKRALGALKQILERLAAGRDHGLYPTVVEELLRAFYLAKAGQVAWSAMKTDTSEAFGDDPAVFAGTALVRNLRDRYEADPDSRTVLVGHSTGAVYICHLLANADAVLPAEAQLDVVLLAPACTSLLLERTLRQHGHRIGNLRIFTMSDELECQDRLVPFTYTRSLLYFISGVTEAQADTPIVGMQRFYNDKERFKEPAFADVVDVRNFLDEKAGRVAWSEVAGAAGLSTASHRHGDFDDDAATLASVVHVIANGFS